MALGRTARDLGHGANESIALDRGGAVCHRHGLTRPGIGARAHPTGSVVLALLITRRHVCNDVVNGDDTRGQDVQVLLYRGERIVGLPRLKRVRERVL